MTRRRGNRLARAALILTCVTALVVAVLPSPVGLVRHAPEVGQPLVDAILAYEADHGVAPASLRRLVPEYIDSIPDPGVPGGRGFRYERLRVREHFSYVWYSLGSRGGVEPELCRYPDGEPGEALLVVGVDDDGRVTGMSSDRMPATEFERLEFDSDTWFGEPDSRYRMIEALRSRSCEEPQTLDELVEELGPPDGRSEYQPDRWKLEVWRQFFNMHAGFERAYFVPSGRYPACLRGGEVKPLANRWALEIERISLHALLEAGRQ